MAKRQIVSQALLFPLRGSSSPTSVLLSPSVALDNFGFLGKSLAHGTHRSIWAAITGQVPVRPGGEVQEFKLQMARQESCIDLPVLGRSSETGLVAGRATRPMRVF